VACGSWRTANLVGGAASAPAANVQTKTAGQTPGRYASVIAERLRANRSVVTIVDCDNDAEHDGQDCQSGDQEPTAGQAFAFNISGCTHISGGGLRRDGSGDQRCGDCARRKQLAQLHIQNPYS